ncbi:MAG: class II glutamine amidotransferase [Phycisphaeraceae bacterium]|nr:MAG: class II glutamine amidotransferase [Phycisphaeraceae bacterium]
MCRWMAYVGTPIFIEDLLFQTGHSLIDQSLNAQEVNTTTNGDGFGVGWYGARPFPGVFKEVNPAWNDPNLRALAQQTKSGLFFAHIRAATGTPVQRTNSHPFAYENWLFQHNGDIPDFWKVQRPLTQRVSDEYYQFIRGSTDSEVMFALALTYGLRNDPIGACARMLAVVEEERIKAGIEEPATFTAALSDGSTIWAFRHSSDRNSKTLYYSRDRDALATLDDGYDDLPGKPVVIASEPLDDLRDEWVEVPESSVVIAGGGSCEVVPLPEAEAPA